MNNILVAYDLNHDKDPQNYDDIISEIKSCGNWAKVNRSTWYISTRLSYKDVYNRIKKVINKDDNIFVTEMKSSIRYGLSKEANDYIHTHWND